MRTASAFVASLLLTIPVLNGLPLSVACAAETEKADGQQPAHTTRSIRGRVVWLADAIGRGNNIKTVPEAAERVLVLEAADGELIPIVEDIRGRSFRLDKRLRDINVELLVRQYKGSPFVQVIQIFAIKENAKYELDYWCDICSIAMVELKPCDCCQADIELRERKVEP